MQEESVKKPNSLVVFLAGVFSTVALAAVAYLIMLLVGKLKADTAQSATYSNPKQIAPYLYEINYTDYTPDTESITHKTTEVFGC